MTTPLCAWRLPCWRRHRCRCRCLVVLALLALGVPMLVMQYSGYWERCEAKVTHTEHLRDANNSVQFTVTTDHPFIFIGGMPRSGTTLMRTILDSHSAVRCGVETRVVPRMLQLLHAWETQKLESARLRAAGILGEPLRAAATAFIMQILMRNGPPAPRLCGKDPYSLSYARLLSSLFPNAKFILMLRDGRAVVHSVISRQVRITGFDMTKPTECLAKWNLQIKMMFNQCVEIGSSRCMPVRYEDLVLDPPHWVSRISEFLGIDHEASMLTPWREIGGQVRLSDTERSTDQVRQPFYLSSLAAWATAMKPEFVLTAGRVAPMLAALGYDTRRLPPRYGKPNAAYWRNATYY